MKVQWRLIEIETGKVLAMAPLFDMSVFFEAEWQRLLKGTGKGIPTGILNCGRIPKKKKLHGRRRNKKEVLPGD